MKIKINTTGNEQWDLAAASLNGEEGIITNTIISDGEVKYDAQFPIYGAMFYGIPSSVATLTE